MMEYGDTCFHIPVSVLPKGAKEGDVLTFRLEIDPVQTAERKNRIAVLMDELFED